LWQVCFTPKHEGQAYIDISITHIGLKSFESRKRRNDGSPKDTTTIDLTEYSCSVVAAFDYFALGLSHNLIFLKMNLVCFSGLLKYLLSVPMAWALYNRFSREVSLPYAARWFLMLDISPQHVVTHVTKMSCIEMYNEFSRSGIVRSKILPPTPSKIMWNIFTSSTKFHTKQNYHLFFVQMAGLPTNEAAAARLIVGAADGHQDGARDTKQCVVMLLKSNYYAAEPSICGPWIDMLHDYYINGHYDKDLYTKILENTPPSSNPSPGIVFP